MEEIKQILQELDWSPLFISLKTGIVATVISFFLGIFAARKVVKASPGKKAVIDGILTLPMVLPPTVAGFFLLLLFSRRRPFGEFLFDEWGITIHTQRDIPEETSYIGYRAHDFIPIWGERGENMLKFYLESSASLPFEHNFYLRPEGEALDDMRICWFVQQEELKQLDERGMPDYLALDEGSILFLE